MSRQPANLQERITLAEYTTMHIGGPAKYFVEAKSYDDVQQAWSWAVAQKIPVRVLGAGANTLVADAGFEGLIILMRNDELVWEETSVIAGAGATNGQLIGGALRHNLGGLQWLIGVPGSVGGSIFGNAGGHGWGLGDQVDWVEVMDETGTMKKVMHDDCAFSYRSSVFKKKPWIILRAQLHLPTIDPVAERAVMAKTTQGKNKNQPTTAKSSGCMFKNPMVDPEKVPSDMFQYVGPDGTISAWRLIVEIGLQGKQLGQIQISSIHANFMINLGGGTADQVVQLLSLVKQQVRDKLGIELQEEVQYLGF